jgi:hypothetical protein
MQFKITAVRKQSLPTKAGGTWTKVEVKTDRTGDAVVMVGFSVPKNKRENLKAGDIVNGFIEEKPWTAANGSSGVNRELQGITLDYIYEFLKTKMPDIEAFNPAKSAAPQPVGGWDNAPQPDASPEVPTVEYPTEEVNTDDIPF